MANYYISTTGSDAADGLTLQTAMSENKGNGFAFQPGDVVNLFRGQKYSQTLTVPASGAAGSTIRYTATGTGANPLISVYRALTDWAPSAGNIYYAALDVNPRNVFIKLDGVIRAAGRWPKTGFKEYTSGGVGYTNGPDIADIPFPPAGGEIVTRPYRYEFARNLITGRTGNNLEFAGGNQYGNNEQSKEGGKAFFIQQHMGTLTGDGDWYYDGTAKRLYMYFAGAPAGRSVLAGGADYAIKCEQSFITFENIDFEGANLAGVLATGNNLEFKQCNSVGGVGGDFYKVAGDHITIQQGVTRNSLNNGIGSNQSTNLLIDRQTIENTGLIPGAGASGNQTYSGIMTNRGSIEVRDCVIKNTGYAPLNIQCNDFVIRRNDIQHGCNNLDDAGGTYLVDPDNVPNKTNKIVEDNIIRYMPGAVAHTLGEIFPMAVGGYADNYMSDVLFQRNTFYSGGWCAALINGGKNNRFLNNKFFDFDEYAFVINKQRIGSTDVSGNVITGNMFYCKNSTQGFYNFYTDGSENPGGFAQYNHNIYIRPLAGGVFAAVNEESGMSFENWKTLTGQDQNSKLITTNTANLANVLLAFNPTAEPLTISLDGLYIDAYGTQYKNSYIINAYDSVILFRKISKGFEKNQKLLTKDNKILVTLQDPS